MVVTIKRRRICRGGVSPPERYNNKKSTNFAVNLSVSRAGGETPPLRTASLIYLSPTAKFLFIEYYYGRLRKTKLHHKTMPDIRKSLQSLLANSMLSFRKRRSRGRGWGFRGIRCRNRFWERRNRDENRHCRKVKRSGFRHF